MQRQASVSLEKEKSFIKYTRKREAIKSNLLQRELEEQTTFRESLANMDNKWRSSSMMQSTILSERKTRLSMENSELINKVSTFKLK